MAEKRLRKQYEQLNVVELRRDIDSLRNALFDLLEGKVEEAMRPARRGQPIRVDGRRRQKPGPRVTRRAESPNIWIGVLVLLGVVPGTRKRRR